MTLREASLLLEQFTINAERREHPFFLVHFSKEDDRYECVTTGLDKYDAMVVVAELLCKFSIVPKGIDLKVMREMLHDLNTGDDFISDAQKN